MTSVGCSSVTAATMINISATICLTHVAENNYVVDMCLKMLLPFGFISDMLYYIMPKD